MYHMTMTALFNFMDMFTLSHAWCQTRLSKRGVSL